MELYSGPMSPNGKRVRICAAELGVALDPKIVDLMKGEHRSPEYLALNPMGKWPTLRDGDFVLWESNSILRYLATGKSGGRGLYPIEPPVRASIDRWLDWTLSTLQPAERPVFHGMIRTPPEQRDMAAIEAAVVKVAGLWAILDAQLAGRRFVENDMFSLADIVLGAYARRWFGIDGIERPAMPNLERWYERLAERASFSRQIARPLR